MHGDRNIHDDLSEVGESCGKSRFHRLIVLAGMKAGVGYGKRRGHYGGAEDAGAADTERMDDWQTVRSV